MPKPLALSCFSHRPHHWRLSSCGICDLGPVLLRGVDLQIGLTERITAALSDRRHASYFSHSYHDLLTQRIY
ncbi:MAG: family transposase [Massilia sp.]|nr:family transposase [Massilia sp.]